MNSGTRMCPPLALCRLVAVVLLIAFGDAHDARAQDTAQPTSLIELRSRVFDMRWDPGRIVRDDHFIPIDRVRWIDEVMERDVDLEPTVIHIDSSQTPGGRYVWLPDIADTRYPSAEGIPEFMRLDGYDVRWLGSSPSNGFFPIPTDRDDFYVLCSYDQGDPGPSSCSATVSYPADLDLRIKVRIYRRADEPINNFAEIARKARLLVFCILDVTDAVKDGTWEQRPYLTPDAELPEIAECRELVS